MVPRAISASTGTAPPHSAIAWVQRGSKAQPGGRFIGFGTFPGIASRR